MTPSELQHLRELCERATPGPWRAIHGRGSGTVQAKDCAIYINVRKSEDEYLDETVARWQRDAAFIAAARSAVPALIEEVERLRAEVAELQGPHCDQCGNPIDPDWCHCGSAVTSHGMADPHEPVPMGCACGYADEDYRRLAKSRGEHLHRLRFDLTRLTSALAEAERERDEARMLSRDAQLQAMDRGASFVGMTAERDRLRALLGEAVGIALTNLDPEWQVSDRITAIAKEAGLDV